MAGTTGTEEFPVNPYADKALVVILLVIMVVFLLRSFANFNKSGMKVTRPERKEKESDAEDESEEEQEDEEEEDGDKDK